LESGPNGAADCQRQAQWSSSSRGRERESSVTLGEVCATGRVGLEEQDERQEWGHEEENGGRK